MKVRHCLDDDLPAIHAIQMKCLDAAQWRREDYLQLSRDSLGIILVAEADDASVPSLAGFAAFHHVLDEAELRNIAVDPLHQRKGVARALLAAGIEALRSNGVSRIFLEVRSSNQPALTLYSSAGFRLLHTRRDYYHDPHEDALVLALVLTPPSESSNCPE